MDSFWILESGGRGGGGGGGMILLFMNFSDVIELDDEADDAETADRIMTILCDDACPLNTTNRDVVVVIMKVTTKPTIAFIG